jgi:hypothetical protein
MLRPTVSRPVSLVIKHPFGAYDQIFITCVTVTVLFLWGALSDERSGLPFVCAAGPCQRSLSRVRVPWDLKPYFTVSDLRLPFSSLLRLAGSRWRYSTPPPHGFSLSFSLNRSYSSLYTLGTDRIINTSPNSYYIVASCSYRTDRVLLHCYVLRICCDHYIATAVV